MRTMKVLPARRPDAKAVHHSLEGVQQRFEHWRGTREGRSPIPAALWATAVEVAQEQGLNRAARGLRLNYYDLKKHVAAARASACPRHDNGPFVELIAPQASGPMECIVDLENAAGAKMRVALKGGHTADLMALSRAFWELAP